MSYLFRTLVSLLTCLLSGCGLFTYQNTNVSNDPGFVGTYATTKRYVAAKDLVVDKWPIAPGVNETFWCLVDPDNLADLKRYSHSSLGGRWNLSPSAYTLRKGSEVRFQRGVKTFTGTTTFVSVYATITDKDGKEVEVLLDYVSETDLFTRPDGRQSGVGIFTGPDPTCLQPKP